MITRLLTLIVIVTLALPITIFTPPKESRQAPWSASSVAAKGKQHKKKRTRNDTTPVTTPVPTPQITTVTRIVRGSVTRTFTSADGFRIPSFGMAAPYPSAIAVSGFTNGAITDVDLVLTGVTHGRPADIDVLLSARDGRRALVMSDVGDAPAEKDIDLTLDDEAPEAIPGRRLSRGTFRPTDVAASDDVFASPAPAPNGSVALSTFDGADPNGTWQVWVMDNVPGIEGEIRGGWALRITAEVDIATVEEQVPAGVDVQLPVDNDTKRAKAKKKGNGKRRHH